MYTYLALGDSYTIGEMVEYKDNFPSQVVQKLQKQNIPITLKKLIAKTGWTTDELLLAIEEENITTSFDYVTLLIGVNNQYRNYPLENYKKEFEILLQLAIQFANKTAKHVLVLSIPDWGLTPFNKDRDPEIISKEIDQYNMAAYELCNQYHVHFISITESTRVHANNEKYLAPDTLHPSKHEYEIWATIVAEKINLLLNK